MLRGGEIGMTRALHAASFLVSRLGTISTFHMQKLLYYAQGCHLALHRKPLFDEPIEAWSNGPVVRDVFAMHKGMFNLKSPWPDAQTLRDAETELHSDAICALNVVADSLGCWAIESLIDSTHSESPWVQARHGLASEECSDEEMRHDEMIEYFDTVCLPGKREPTRNDLTSAAFDLYLQFAHNRAFTPPTIRSEDADSWYEMLDAPPREIPSLRKFLSSVKTRSRA